MNADEQRIREETKSQKLVFSEQTEFNVEKKLSFFFNFLFLND